MMKPYFSKRHAICFACDDKYLDKTYVCIKSIIENSTETDTYEIVILESNILEYQKKVFHSLETENIKIHFFNMNERIRTEGLDKFFISGHVSIATYFRFFIPEIFSNYEKVLYLDGDIIVCKNINQLINEDLGENLLGVIKDIDRYVFKPERITFVEQQLKMSCESYFCAGVILYNIDACKRFNLKEKCCNLLAEIPNPMFHDQDILNSVCNGIVKFLPSKWHFQAWAMVHNNLLQIKEKSPQSIYDDLIETSNEFHLIHFGGGIKPWLQASRPFAQFWWNVARTTPFYESFVHEMQQHSLKYLTYLNSQIQKSQIDVLNKIQNLNQNISAVPGLLNSSFSNLNSQAQEHQIDVLHKIQVLNQMINEVPQQLDSSFNNLNSQVQEHQIDILHKIQDLNQKVKIASQYHNLKRKRRFLNFISKITFGQKKTEILQQLQEINSKLEQLNC